MPALGCRIRLDRDDRPRFEAQFLSGASARRLDRGISPTPPYNEGSADDEQRRGVLDYDLERAERPSGDDIE